MDFVRRLVRKYTLKKRLKEVSVELVDLSYTIDIHASDENYADTLRNIRDAYSNLERRLKKLYEL